MQKKIFNLLWANATEVQIDGSIVRQITSPDFSKIALAIESICIEKYNEGYVDCAKTYNK